MFNSIHTAAASAHSAQAPSQTLNGTKGDDVVHISRAEGLAGCLGLYNVNVNGCSQLMTRQQLENTQFNLGRGDDVLLVDADVNAAIHADGGKGRDLLIGGAGNDTLRGGRGDDIVLGGRGNDTLHGGRGNDQIYGGRGNDQLHGGRGNDELHGGRGHDHLFGGRGNDRLDGGRGADCLVGGPGCDDKKFDWHDLLTPVSHRVLSALLG